MSSDLAEQAKGAVSNATDQVKSQAADLTQNAQEQATTFLDEQKGMAAQRLGGVAQAIRHAGQEFADNDESTLAHYTDTLAGQIENFSNSLRDREIGSLIDDARQLAYRQPEWFVAGALAFGFAIGRFFKSSRSRSMQQNYQGNYQYDYQGRQGNYQSSYNQNYGDQSYSGQYYGTRGSGNQN
jgi:hypothetical protein